MSEQAGANESLAQILTPVSRLFVHSCGGEGRPAGLGHPRRPQQRGVENNPRGSGSRVRGNFEGRPKQSSTVTDVSPLEVPQFA